MSKARQVADDLTVILRDYGRRITSLEALAVSSSVQARAPRGIVGTPYTSTSNSIGYIASGDTDMTFNADLFAGRHYVPFVHAQVAITASSSWNLNCSIDGISRARFAKYDPGGSATFPMDSMFIWTAPADDNVTFTVSLIETSGTATLTLNAGTNIPRIFGLIDLGKP